MCKKSWFLGVLGAVAFCLVGTANVRAVNIDDYTMNMDDWSTLFVGGTGEEVNNVDQWRFIARSFVQFLDVDGSGTITAGDKFRDYVAVRVDGFFDKDLNNLTPLAYGTGQGRTFGITVILDLEGIQTVTGPPGAYSVTAINRMDFYYDDGEDYTQANFLDLSTFDDGLRFETFLALIDGGGANATPVLPDGTIALIVALLQNPDGHDVVNMETDFLTAEGDPVLVDLSNLLVGIVDANNLALDISAAPFEDFFGFTAGIDTGLIFTGGTFAAGGTDPATSGTAASFGFMTESDGTFNKATIEQGIIPEPATATLGLMGLAGLLAGAFRRRRA